VLKGNIVLENKWTLLQSAYIEFVAKQSNVSRICWHNDLLGVGDAQANRVRSFST